MPLLVGRLCQIASPFSSARSPRKRSTAWMLTGLSVNARLQTLFTGVITNAAVNGRQRIVFNQFAPCGFVLTVLGQRQPRLDILACRAGIVTGWQEVNVFGATRAQSTRTSSVARQVSALCQVFSIHSRLNHSGRVSPQH